jgi:N6-adenosine-specific RNA methylase IME4
VISLDEVKRYWREHDLDARAAKDFHLYLWVTAHSLGGAFEVLETWGFEHRTILTWVKPQIGTDHYFRGATEHILFATRGRLSLKDYGIPTWCRCDRVLRQDRVAAAG